MAKKVYYNADCEEPMCSRCEHITDDFDCENMCGSEHGWFGYERVEIIKNPEESEGI